MPSAEPATPARGTRPRNRRAITLIAATDLFFQRGYAQVSMTDIAEATNVGASALYRHFPSKADLLVGAISAGIAPYTAVLADADAGDNADAGGDAEAGGDPDAESDAAAAARLAEVLRRLAAVAIEHRRLGVLWQRDARNLSDDEQRGLREELSTTTGHLAGLIAATRPGLDAEGADTLAWCTMGALVSIGFHSLEIPRPAFDELLVDIVTDVIAAPLPAAHAAVADPDLAGHGHPVSRRDGLITVATALFADRGFAATGIDEIGDAVGMAGPSVYSHFESKQQILAAAIQRASGLLRDELDAVLLSPDTAPVKLARLVDSYVRLVNRDRFVVRTLISEMDQLPGPDRELARHDQRRYIDAWVELYVAFTDVDPVSARIRVQAVLLFVNDAVQTPHLRSQPGFEQVVTQLAKNVLGVLLS